MKRVIIIMLVLSLFFVPICSFSELRSPYKTVIIRSQNKDQCDIAIEGIREFLLDTVSVSIDFKVFDYQNSDKKNLLVIREIKQYNPDLIFALGYIAASFANQNFKKPPLVYGLVSHPQRFNFYRDNSTGVSSDISLKDQLSILLEVIPQTKRVGIIYDPTYNYKKIQTIHEHCEALGLSLVSEPVRSHKSVPEAVRSILPNIDVLWLISDPTVILRQSVEYIILRTAWSKCPVVSESPYLVRIGALYSVTNELTEIGRQMGDLAWKILKGISIDELVPQQPRGYSLVLNLKTANKLHIRISDEVMKKASVVIE